MSAPWLRNGNGQSNTNAASIWTEHVANDNRVYYWNSETKTSSWEKPDALKTAEELKASKASSASSAAAEKGEDWKEYETADGKKYYHNHVTGVTTWDKPESLIAAERALKEAAELAARKQRADDLADVDLDDNTRQELERLDRITVAGADGKAISAAMYALTDEAVPVFKTAEQAEEAFHKMLRKVGVQPDWSWDQAMKAAIKDPVWRALPNSLARKNSFEQYVIDVKKATIGKQKDRVEKLKHDFEQMLRRHDEIKSYSQWNNIKGNLEGEVAYKAAIDDEEREALFDMYTEKLESEEAQREKEKTTKAVATFSELLRNMETIDLTTTWKDAQVAIHQNVDMTNDPQIKSLRKIDTLLAFEQYIKDLDRERINALKLKKIERRREQRQNRRKFVALLQDLRSAGQISVGSKWKDVYPLFKDSEEYLNLVGQPGSSPMDFFWDVCEDLEQELRGKKTMVLDVLDAKQEPVTIQTTFEHFKSIMQSDNRTSHISDSDLQKIYDQLMEKAQKKADEQRKAEERRTRRKQDDLRSAMKKLDPPIGVNDTYEAVRIRISMLAEFTSLDTESAREAAYAKYIRRLKERIEEDEERAARRERHSHRRSPAARDRRHDRERRSSRDSRRSGNDDRDGHDSRRRHRSERRGSLSHNPRSPKRPRHDPPPPNGRRPRPDDEPMLDYGDDLESSSAIAKDAKAEVNAGHGTKSGSAKGDDSSEDGEIAE